MATIFDLFEVSSISEHTTYSKADGNLLGVVDNVDSADLSDGEFDEGDTVQIDGLTYTIDHIQEPSSSGRFSLEDGTDRSFNPQSESNLDVVFLTVSNGDDVRHFIVPNDSYGDMNVQSIRTGEIEDVGGNDAALVSTTDNNVNAVCFVANTMIQTPRGSVPVEDLEIGDLVWTRDHSCQKVRYIISSNLDFNIASEKLKPIIFEQDSLGPGRPSQRLLVSPQHRMLVTTESGATVLVPAKALTERKGVRVARGRRKVTYFHLVFSRHEIIFANDTPTESMFAGRMALQAVPRKCRAEIEDIFGRAILDEFDRSDSAAAPILCVQEAKRNALTFR
jgi:hypothetical protein